MPLQGAALRSDRKINGGWYSANVYVNPSTGNVEPFPVVTPLDNLTRYSAFGELMTGQLVPHAAWRFDYGTTPNTRIVSVHTANGGGAAVAASKVSLTTSVAVNGIARVTTRKRLRYLNGIGGLARFTAVFDTPKADSHQFIGVGDTTDGFFFGYQGTDFGVLRRRNGSDNFIPMNTWNGESVTFNQQLGNIYQIRFQWLGFGYIRFYILDPAGQADGFKLVHTIEYPNTSADVSILNPTLPLFAEVSNTGNNTNLKLESPSAAAFLEGETGEITHPLDVHNAFDSSATFSDTNNNHLVTIRNKSSFGGVANRIPVEITSINLGRGSAGAALTRVRVYRTATTAGVRAYVDFDTNNSPIDTSITTTTITSLNAEKAYTITSNVTAQYIAFAPGELVLEPGESISIGIQDGGVQATEVVATVNWREMF